ncbi:hypothetical protein FHS78_002168 [Parvibaculum indicum]|uniref:hypothetical protein n=1 Tax=Parvibaculum indicum TaxID=562969 RepID=UPI00141FABBE|nr:hypothetical protein [Parvibaculum indicum]NIJ41878.1 hypothetical protein [Parvibaculum indicum]
MTKLLAGAAADMSSTPIDWQGGSGAFWVWGDFDGASVSLEASPDGENWFALGEQVVMHEKGVGGFALGPCRLRATLANASASTSVSAVV